MKTKDCFTIQGLAGQKKLRGTVAISGAKNAALKAMAASVLFKGPVTLENIPETEDIRTMAEILQKLGAKVTGSTARFPDGGQSGSGTLVIDTSTITTTDIDNDLAKTMRASVVLTGPMLGRFGRLSFPAPGGCVIGARPIDLFIDGYTRMGATATDKDCSYEIVAKKLVATDIFFDKISVGATETLMMAAVLANGTTTLKNCALEPEIVNVAKWLNECGARINGAGTSTITIEGTNGELLEPKSTYVAIPDRIEAGSYLLLGALCAEELILTNCRPDHLEAVIQMLRKSGVPIETENGSANKMTGRNEADMGRIIIRNNTKPNSEFTAFSVRTHEYPGFPTDLQAQVVTFLTQTSGDATILETIFEGRFKYVTDLTKMGATITEMNPREVLIKGPAELRQLPDAEELSAHDIRAGFAIVMAAMVGTGAFRVNNVHLIDRGYGGLEAKLGSLGASIKRQ